MAVRFDAIKNPLEELVHSGKNAADILCPKDNCNCMIFRANTATWVERDGSKLSLPDNVLPDNVGPLADDANEIHFWRVTNMMDFENVGFSKAVGPVKYLSCADCDIGPLGYHDTTTEPKEFLICARRARYRF
ncbi:Mss4-like protein [Radiomyces spectabilis]|uniref:Mss4-like protein n=1 Tax=Radiomyces spectabilis TaxID=64574 RepID=UPI002220A24F|nr:Mss4-like protein [Radiomyces spectabilis]KAI8393660.1 Mss4-like protein [Radiomyces spectabilis]